MGHQHSINQRQHTINQLLHTINQLRPLIIHLLRVVTVTSVYWITQMKMFRFVFPTLDSDCSSEKTKDGVSTTEQYDCRPITRTVCTEYEDYDQIEVCAVSFNLQQVDTSAKLVDVDWVKECKDEVVCQQPHSHGAYHKDSYCKEQIKSVCYDSPGVRPVERQVVLKLPQPY